MARRKHIENVEHPPDFFTVECDVPGCESKTTITKERSDGWFEVRSENRKYGTSTVVLCPNHFPDQIEMRDFGKALALAVALGFGIINQQEKQND